MSRCQNVTPPLSTLALAALLGACSHPLEIVGSGDITASGSGGSGCSYEDSPCVNYIVNGYNTTYSAVPRENFGFLHWYGCPAPQGNKCSFAIPATTVHQYWGQTVAPLRAIFSPEVSLGNLSGDFAPSADCQGHVFSPNPEIVFRFRESTSAVGEQQRQCVGNTILVDSITGNNFLVWLDILHIDGNNMPVYDIVNNEFPIREIYASFAQQFIVGKTYTLEGIGLSAGPSHISIQITWLDINADFAGFSQCIVTETQSPQGAPTRRKTYCPRFDGSYEIKENVLADPLAASNGA
jgi:hypothetical protein